MNPVIARFAPVLFVDDQPEVLVSGHLISSRRHVAAVPF